MPKISVIVAAYNCSSYISQSIDSILAQDYPSLEIIILNDGSTDDTGEVLDKYSKCSLIKIINQKHRGQGWAKNRLIKCANGKYIALFDADDIMLPGRLKKQIYVLDNDPSFGACYGKARITDTHLVPKKDRLYNWRVSV